MKVLSFSARLRLHVPDNITEEQISAIAYNITSEGCPTLLVQDQTETHLMDVASAEDAETINDLTIDEIDVWVDADYHIREY